MPDDGYTQYYTEKLWKLIPAVYRTLDSTPDDPADLTERAGPLREMVNRIAAQAAVIRRSMDRMWEDQSIETCDDWLIPYIGDLVATNLVACMDAQGQRLDVAKTIYYRRRKGTVGLLEELASDVAHRDARVVEFFRRLGRTRHSFDPPIGQVPFFSGPTDPLQPAVIEGLAGAYTRTPMGGYADLRQAYGAAKAMTPFDEFAYTADFRRGRQYSGWHNIPRLGVFVWWLLSFGVEPSTPVEDADCKGQFTFDPSGREIPLFARSQRTSEQFGEHWISPDEWQLPVNISKDLFALQSAQLYPDSLSVLEGDTVPYSVMTLDRAVVNPERGRFRLQGIAPASNVVHVTYHYGFSSEIGAGPYDQRLGGEKLPARPSPVTEVKDVASKFATAVAGIAGKGTVVIDDSLTYSPPADLGGVQDVALLGANQQRPLVRWTTTPRVEWTITGTAGSTLVLQGLWLCGADVVLKGEFESVVIRYCTLDPGNSGASLKTPQLYMNSVDKVPLAPTHLFVEAKMAFLDIQRSIVGPIRTRNGGGIQSLNISDSIVQAIPEDLGGDFVAEDFFDLGSLADKLHRAPDPVSQFVRSKLSDTTLVDAFSLGAGEPSNALRTQLLNDLNALIGGPSIFKATRFAQVHLSALTQSQIGKSLSAKARKDFNRRLLTESYPAELGDLALSTSSGTVSLQRTTVLGPIAVHRLNASECILDDVAIAEDQQHGCIRFTAYADGSVVHEPYESVTVAPQAALFRTRDFGRPNYARLKDDADLSITSGREGASILTGAENGSEMGAFALEKIPLKRRGLSQKFAEFMPIGLMPVFIDEPVLTEE
jgi:hypothetical protein